MKNIIDNMECLEVCNNDAIKLCKLSLIYFCSDCECYHLCDNITFDDVEDNLK